MSYQGSPPAAPARDVCSSVKSLLLATKQLQETLRLWSLEKATESDVSDCYVRIGNEFNATVTAFSHHDIELTEIFSIPKDLREVLEVCLGEDPSPQLLQRYMPEIRRILYQLYQGLQNKQDAYTLATTSGRGTLPSYIDSRR